MSMVKNKQELFDAIKSESIPLDIETIWEERVHIKIKYTCENPELLFDAFLRGPEMFPYPDELLILWQTNNNSIVGYLRNIIIYKN